jgi:hypothetical protein
MSCDMGELCGEITHPLPDQFLSSKVGAYDPPDGDLGAGGQREVTDLRVGARLVADSLSIYALVVGG